jgi:cell division protein FtsL
MGGGRNNLLLAKEKPNYYAHEEQTQKQKPKTRVKQKVKVTKKRKIKLKPVFIVTTGIVIAFLLGILLAAQYARLATAGYNIVNKKKELGQLKTVNERLQSEYNQLQSLDRVEKIATTKLGMVTPNTEGFIYVPVESKSSSPSEAKTAKGNINSVSREESKPQDTIAKVSDFVKNWTSDVNKAEGGFPN